MSEEKKVIVYPDAPKTVNDVSAKFIIDFLKDKLATGEVDKVKVAEYAKKLEAAEKKAGKATIGTFNEVRKDFIKDYYPDLLKKKKNNKPTFLDELKALAK